MQAIARLNARSAASKKRRMANPNPRALVVSLHDVSPWTREACARAIDELAALGVTRTSLLVIPDHHRRGSLRSDPTLCRWLHERAQAGHEMVVHGFHHQRARRASEGIAARLTTRVYTAGEGEFYDLDREGARALYRQGCDEFRAAGLSPSGFIAPAWLLSAEAEAALREESCDYTTRLGSVIDLQNRAVHSSQSLVWSVRSAWRRAISRAWNALLFRRLERAPLLRIAIHPVDLEHPAIWAQVRALLTAALRDREPITYAEWIARGRLQRK